MFRKWIVALASFAGIAGGDISAEANPGTGGSRPAIAIAQQDANRANAVVYDNELGKEPGADPTTVLGGGSIQIHR